MLDVTALPRLLQGDAARDLARWQAAAETVPGTPAMSEQRTQEFQKVFVGSAFVANSLIAKPELFGDLLASLDHAPAGEVDTVALSTALAECESDADLDACLRSFRHLTMLRILWQDFNDAQAQTRYQNTVSAVSQLAEVTIQAALDFHYHQLAQRFGIPRAKHSGAQQHMVVLGMGKLGAAELNVSSDIDLIFAYPESGETVHEDSEAKANAKTLSNQEFFVRLGQRLIKSLDATTVHGFVFRVDMRLRPYGQSGALALNFDSMEDYYQTQGRDWERFAMIKARPVAGDKQAGRELMAMLGPFTYRQYIDFSAIDALRATKALINREVQRKGMSSDLKLGFGGIREIEFIVQAFQLIRGGRDQRLRDPRVCYLLPLLENEGYLPKGSAEALMADYWLLRNAEHAQQGYQDKQTQAMPCDEKGESRMAWVLNYESWTELDRALQACRHRVNSEFQAVIADPEEAHEGQNLDLHDWQAMWMGTLDLEHAQACLQGLEVEQIERVFSILKSLRESRVVVTMQASGRERLESFMPRLLSTLAQEHQGAGIVETLSRVMALVEAVVRRSAYLVLLLENPDALQQLVKLCAASPWIADQLAKYPALLDELLDARSLYTPPDKQQLQDELRQDTLRLAWDDLEGHMDTLRHFRQAHALRVAASEVTNILPLMKVSDYLTYIAEVILEHVLAVAWEQLVARHGYPTREDGSTTEADFIIVGYGKLGGIELGHGSDLDLVFIHDADLKRYTDGERSIDNQTFYTRLGQRIIHILSTKMASGELYETDMRLRPSGNSGLLVSSLTAFEKYQRQEAWVWEHQALVRARVVAGSANLAQRFEAVRNAVLAQKRELTPLAEEVFKMREKMRQHLGSSSVEPEQFHLKQDLGGIVDIEFMVQYAVLAWAEKSPALVRYTDNIRILGCLEQMQLLSEDSTAQLIDAYKAYRSAGHRLALQRQSVTVESSQFTTEREAVKRLWQQWLPTTL